MKKLIASLIVVGALIASVSYGTIAYFSDTEASVGNTLSAGTIDIAVDGENPWSRTYTQTWTDFKPSVTQYIEFDVTNVGENPVVLRKHIYVTDESTGLQSEPECEAEGGTWSAGVCSGMTDENNNLSEVIHYDMTVGGVEIIPESRGIMMGDIESLWVPLGTIEPSETVHVIQSYHLDSDAGNEYQGDIITFDIELYAEQRLGPGLNTDTGVVLENKTGNPDWYSVMDETWALLNYDGSGYNLRAFGLEAGQTYRLVHSQDPYSSFTPINSGLADPAGELVLSGGDDLTALPSDSKIWLLYGASDWGNDLLNLWEGNLVN